MGGGSGGSVIVFHPTRVNEILMKALIFSKVPGRQTVSRAEACALHNLIHTWTGDFDLEIIVDATYSISGMDLEKQDKHLRGVNGDILGEIYQPLEFRLAALTIVKVKSHATAVQVLALQNTSAMLALNELADVAAEMLTDHQGNREERLSAVGLAETQLENICRQQ